MASNIRLVKIGALLFSQFSLLLALNFQFFGMVAAYKMMGHKRKKKEGRFLLIYSGHRFPNSFTLLHLICVEVTVLVVHFRFVIRQASNKIFDFIAVIPLKPGSRHHVSLETNHWACPRHFSTQVTSLFRSRAEISF